MTFRYATAIAVGGVRVSTDQQVDRFGPQRQRDDIQREADRHSLRLTNWVEEAISGADDERAYENRYYELARAHPGLNVIFSHPNRVGRHVEVTVGIARKIHKLGGTVYIAGIGSLRDPRSWKEFLRDAVDAEIDYSTIINNLSKGKFDKARLNQWPEGKPPYGYRLIRLPNGRSTTIEPDPEQAQIYGDMVVLALQNHGAHTIAKVLNERGVPEPRSGGTRQHGGWSSVQVARILKNPRCLGYTDYQGPDGQTTRITYPALITPGQYAQVMVGFESRKKYRTPRTRWPTLLGGHLTCAECGGSMNVHAARDRAGVRRWAHYICRTWAASAAREARGLPLCGHNRHHRVADLDAEGWAAVVTAVSDPEFVTRALSAPALSVDHGPRLAEIDQEMGEIVTRAVRLGLPDSAVQAGLGALKAERLKLLAAMQPAPVTVTADHAALAQSYAERLMAAQTLEEKRAALALWQVRLLVDGEGVRELKVQLAVE